MRAGTGMDEAPEFQDIETWVNTGDGLMVSGIEKPVILLDFWSYADHESLQHLPRIKKLWERYQDHGLAVIGVHTPVFSFEEESEHVETAVDTLDITYPVALDTKNTTWAMYGNRYRPRQTVIGEDGHIRYESTGAAHGELEDAIRRLLMRTGEDLPERVLSRGSPDENDQFDTDDLVSPTIHAGESGTELGNTEFQVCHPYARIDYRDERPDGHRMNRIYLQGSWIQDDESVTFQGSDGYATVRFTAAACNAVLSPGDRDEIRVTVELDGEPVPEQQRGADIEISGDQTCISVTDPGLYQVLDRDPVAVGELQFTPQTEGFQLYAVSFS